MRDKTLEVTIPASMLNDLAALAGGYTMSQGQFISRSVIGDAWRILYDAGYEYGLDDERLFS